MKPRPPPSPARRVGLRAVAEAAGVSLMTVSLALRNSPRVAPKTRRHIAEVAAKLGYRPDPEISRLMSRLRPARSAEGVVLAMIDLLPQRQERLHPYDAGVRQGIERRARQLGYSVSLFALHDYGGRLSQLLRVVRCRGITGVLLLPSTPPVALDPAVNWDGLSVVAVTTSVSSPQFHQVVPNHLLNIRILVETLMARGRQRCGIILSESLHRRTHETYAMVLTVMGHGDGILILRDEMPASAGAATMLNWLLKVPAVAERCRGRDVVALTNPTDADLPFFDQQPDLIGESAVSLLTGMVHNHETGVPRSPQVTAIRGTMHRGSARASS
jgi:DNA-binding LacI/PurR family transcriptional regulator